jgi:hypothetical protein
MPSFLCWVFLLSLARSLFGVEKNMSHRPELFPTNMADKKRGEKVDKLILL